MRLEVKFCTSKISFDKKTVAFKIMDGRSIFIFTILLVASAYASSDINVCLRQHIPIELYNYASGQCLSSIEIDNELQLQMHGCLSGDRFVFHAHRGSDQFKSQNVYQLVNKVSGKCLTAGPLGHSPTPNTPVLQFPCNGTLRQQLWKNHDVWNRMFGSAYYQISNLDNEKLCLTADASDISIPNRGLPYMFPCNYNQNEQFWLAALGMMC